MILNKCYFAEYSLSSTNATQVFVDLPIPEARDARNR
jgi:hypothetical protein